MADGSEGAKSRLASSDAPARSDENGETIDDLHADEKDPSRIAPSAEGIVTFAGLPADVRDWLAGELAKVGSNGSVPGSNGHATEADQ
jgi:hypothetical protein